MALNVTTRQLRRASSPQCEIPPFHHAQIHLPWDTESATASPPNSFTLHPPKPDHLKSNAFKSATHLHNGTQSMHSNTLLKPPLPFPAPDQYTLITPSPHKTPPQTLRIQIPSPLFLVTTTTTTTSQTTSISKHTSMSSSSSSTSTTSTSTSSVFSYSASNPTLPEILTTCPTPVYPSIHHTKAFFLPLRLKRHSKPPNENPTLYSKTTSESRGGAANPSRESDTGIGLLPGIEGEGRSLQTRERERE